MIKQLLDKYLADEDVTVTDIETVGNKVLFNVVTDDGNQQFHHVRLITLINLAREGK